MGLSLGFEFSVDFFYDHAALQRCHKRDRCHGRASWKQFVACYRNPFIERFCIYTEFIGKSDLFRYSCSSRILDLFVESVVEALSAATHRRVAALLER